MIFAEMPLDEAADAILAHSLKGHKLGFRKGRKLSAEDIEALRQAGFERVVAAKLEADDVPEDEAALRIAEAIAGEHLTIGNAFTGRVNLHAEQAGLVLVERERIDEINLIDEQVTVATLSEFEPVRPKQMVATIKIIPFAVRRDVLEGCLRVAKARGPLVRVAPYRHLDVTLIQTWLPGMKPTILDKTVATTAERVAGTGGRLIGEARSEHEVEALAEKIRGSSGDLLLIAGASAITDRKDVLPAALEAAGGEVLHFGMPVDPGNLMLLGRLGERTVLGLPGCCRSLKLNGLDWVLQRIAASLPVTPRDIMRMGVGGLLAEIPRPQPREGSVPARPGKVAAIVLAAGQSRRMGRHNKLLAILNGRQMVTYVVDAALGSKADPVIVVTGHDQDKIERAIGKRKVRWVHNSGFAEGLSTSLAAGLAELPEEAEGVLVLLGDMPRIRADQINRLIAAFDPTEGRAIVVPTVAGKRGNPVLFSTRFVPEMRQIGGDVGARHLLGEHADEVFEIEMEDDAALLDIDTPAALEALFKAAS